MIEVFVSSDPESVKMGRKWLDQITNALKSCKVEIILASPESVKRPWVNFEGGAGWIRDISVIPVCHSGMTTSKLPAPLNSLQAATAVDAASMKTLFGVLAKVVESRTPEVDFTEFIEVVKSFEETSREMKVMVAMAPVVMTDGLSPYELMTLLKIADETSSPGETVAVYSVKTDLVKSGLRNLTVLLAIKMLSRKDLVETASEEDYDHENYPVVRITENGWGWIEANQHKIVLTSDPPPFEEKKDGEMQFKESDMPF